MSFFYTYKVITVMYFYEVTQECDHNTGRTHYLFSKSLVITKYSQIISNALIYLHSKNKLFA